MRIGGKRGTSCLCQDGRAGSSAAAFRPQQWGRDAQEQRTALPKAPPLLPCNWGANDHVIRVHDKHMRNGHVETQQYQTSPE